MTLNKRRTSYLALDVETPNRHNDRICQIGLVYYDPAARMQPQCFCYLVNPDTHFDEQNFAIHGIHAEQCLQQQNFQQLWVSHLGELVSQSIIVAHNATFDLSVLSKTMAAYNLTLPDVPFIDTLALARNFYPELPDHTLPTVSRHLGYQIQSHHQAGEDAYAAFHIMNEAFRQFGSAALSIETYRPVFVKAPDTLQSLKDILGGIVSDRRIEFDEAVTLSMWLRRTQSELPDHLFSELSQTLFEVLQDGVIDSDEESKVLTIIDRILHPASTAQSVVFVDKVFVLSGDFQHGMKPDVASMIESKGGSVVGSVSKKVDFVVIGSYGSDLYANGTYGTKVKRAMELQDQGCPIAIISEDALYA
jgi:DNA polymerase III epsilon subunit-like protein